jgi:hypothetical protein
MVFIRHLHESYLKSEYYEKPQLQDAEGQE